MGGFKLKNILYISLIDWFWIKQRPQHISEFLSRNNKITYVSIRSWRNNTNVNIAHSKNDYNINKSNFNVNPNMNIIRKRLIPKENSCKYIKNINDKIMSNILKRLDKENNYDVIIITHPKQYDIIPKNFFNSKLFIYDCMDNYKCWPNFNKNKLINNEKKIVESSKYVITTSQDLYNEIIKCNPHLISKIHVVNNGVDIETFDINKINKVDDVDIFKQNNKKKVGYIGTISIWMDLDLIKNVALKNSNIDFYIIGPVEKGTNLEKYSDIENIIFTGSQPYYSIPNILNDLDVCIMPFKKTDLVKSVNPVKIYEYLAMGKPVIALRYDETEKFGDLIYTYETQKEFENCLNKILHQQEEKSVMDKRKRFAKQNSWKCRTNQIEKFINEGMKNK